VFGLSLRDVELILSERGITISHERVLSGFAPKVLGLAAGAAAGRFLAC
jgi:hypothetical protein